MSKLQKGFGALPIILVLALVFLLGAGAWYYVKYFNNMESSVSPAGNVPIGQPSLGNIFNHKPGEKFGDWTLESITGTSLENIVITFSGPVTMKGGPDRGNGELSPQAEYFNISNEEKVKLPHLPEDPRDYFPRSLKLDNREVFLQKAQEEGIQLGVGVDGIDRMVTMQAAKFITKADPFAAGGLSDHIVFAEFVR